MLHVKMRLSILLIMVTLQLAQGQSPKLAQNFWTPLPNVVVAKVDGVSIFHQPLTCLGLAGGAERKKEVEEGDITWRKDGVATGSRGNDYKVVLVETLGGGDYSCHSRDGSVLNRTTVLLMLVENNTHHHTDTESLQCTAQSLSGAFHCSWRWERLREGEVLLVLAARQEEVNCSMDERDQQWTCSSEESNITCSVSASGNSISCLDRKHCPYSEESKPIALTVYTRHSHHMKLYERSFFLSKIVTPDRVTLREVNHTTVEWTYPDSWNTPHSFFPLTFQVRMVKKGSCDVRSRKNKNHTTEHNQWSVEKKRKHETLCVRAQDALCDSNWSGWSQHNFRRRLKERSGH